MNDTSKRRLNLALSMDNPLQKQAWEILCAAEPGTRTTMICHALCEYQRQQSFLRAIRQLLEDKLSHIEVSAVERLPEKPQKQSDHSAALAFIRSLQAE